MLGVEQGPDFTLCRLGSPVEVLSIGNSTGITRANDYRVDSMSSKYTVLGPMTADDGPLLKKQVIIRRKV